MKKDLQSYEKHNKGYESDKDYYTVESIIKRTEGTNDFTRAGFAYALSITKNTPKIHVDIGSGVGWLVRKMSPYFEKTIGIELSHAAVLSAKKLTENLTNASFIEKDMIDGYKELNLKEPAFFTTGAVLSHIEDYYVKEFLKLINNAPKGSVLFFSENYDKNMQWSMWHIRSKEWWLNNLPNWQLIFCNIENDGYASGIYGTCIGEDSVLKNHYRGFFWGRMWCLSGVLNSIKRVAKKILRILHLSK